jgi:hypothetical protein
MGTKENPQMITIQFNTDNAAFEENPSEVYVVLELLAHKINKSKPGDEGTIKDSNGNTIGTWERN